MQEWKVVPKPAGQAAKNINTYKTFWNDLG
jgi:hypothetical protein